MTPLSAGAARAVADVSEGLILASVEIARPPERVFQALFSEELPKWWGSPEEYRTTGWTGDVRPGGKWRCEGIGRDGKPFSVSGEFREVERPTRVVQTWRYDWVEGGETVITYRLEPLDGGQRTRVLIRHSGFTNTEACAGHAIGWERVFGWLSGYFPLETNR